MSQFLKRWWWAFLAVAVCLGLWRLSFDVDILNLLPPDEPTVQGLKLYQQHFTNARELVITLRAPDAERAERLASGVAACLRQQTNLVTSVSWQPPWVEDPAQMAELLGCFWLNQPPDSFRRADESLGTRPTGGRAGPNQGRASDFHVADGHGPACLRSLRLAEHTGTD